MRGSGPCPRNDSPVPGAAHEPASARADEPRRRRRRGPARRDPGRLLPARAAALGRRRGPGAARASRATHARAALARLEREGLLVHSLHRGLEVVRISVDDVRDLYATRRTLELAGLEAMVRRRPADDVWLQAAVTSMTEAAKAGDGRAAVAADAAFHLAIVASTSSRRLRTAAEAALRELRIVLAVADRVVLRPRRARRRPRRPDGRADQRAAAVGARRAARPPAPRRVPRARGHARRLARRQAPRGEVRPALERGDRLAVAADRGRSPSRARLAAQQALERGAGHRHGRVGGRAGGVLDDAAARTPSRAVTYQARGASSTISCATVNTWPRVHSGATRTAARGRRARLEPRAGADGVGEREPRVGERGERPHALAAAG